MAQVIKTPNLPENNGIELISIEAYLQEVYNYNKSDKARQAKKAVWVRLSRYTVHDHNGMTPDEVWSYIRTTTQNNVDKRNVDIVNFLKGFVAFCKIDHPDIIIKLTGNSHKEGGKYSKPIGTYTLSPEKRKRKDYLCKLNNNTLPAMVGGSKTIMSRVGGLSVSDTLSSHRILGVPKIVRKGTYDVEEDEGKPLTADQARYVIESLSHKKIISICYFMNYTGFRSGEVFNVKKSELVWDGEIKLLKVRIPPKVIKDTVTKGWRYATELTYEKIKPFLVGLGEDDHPFRTNENQSLESFEMNVRKTLRVVYNSREDLCEKDPDNNRYFYNVHSWRARNGTEYARTHGIPDADGYLRHARGLTTYYKKTKEEREQQFKRACLDLAIYQVDKKEAELKLKDREISENEILKKRIAIIEEEMKRRNHVNQ